MDAGIATSVVSDLGYVVPAGIAGFLFTCLIIYMRWQESKQNKDREEHIKKWDSLIALQEKSMQSLIAAHERKITLLIENHRSEMDRQFKLCERNTSALEALSHNYTLLTKEQR